MKRVILAVGIVCLIFASDVFAYSGSSASDTNAAVSREDVAKILSGMRGLNGIAVVAGKGEAARVSRKGGYLRTLGAPANHYFPVSKTVVGNSMATAKNFITEHSAAFGIKNKAVDFVSKKSQKRNGRSYERFQQTYSLIPVFGAEVIIQLNESDGVEYVVSDIMRETIELDDGKVSTVPTVAAPDAKFLAIELMAEKHPGIQLDSADANLMIYNPEVVGNSGPTRLVWQTVVVSVSIPTVNEFIMIDAHMGDVALHYSQIRDVMNRQIYDSANTAADPGTLSRSEGGPATGIADVDLIYNYLGNAYNFYKTYHGRDGIDGSGLAISASVRFKSQDPNLWNNAWFDSNNNRFYFDSGYANADDIVAHEFTHGVTNFASGLIYNNESGAIDESFSDMWGEWIDLGNGAGNDGASVRWLVGEDIPGIGAIRNMADPTSFSDPDRKGSPNWYSGGSDNGGVHTNSGVGNKLCYLLTDGGIFNTKTVTGMGISRVAKLFYEVQTALLPSSADYARLHDSLTHAAINLGWSVTDRDNLENACLATEIFETYISSVEDLQALCDSPEDNFYKYFILTEDLDCSGVAITPIGNSSTPFIGIFDGKGHTIRNLTITAPTQDYVGLFGYVGSGGQIRNLGVKNVNITGRNYVGGLVGIYGSLTNCYATGSVTGTGNYVGGLVGRGGNLISCYATCSVTGTDYVGGLMGYTNGYSTSCRASGSVNGHLHVGGLVGEKNGGTLTSSHATGSVIAYQGAGGLAGTNYGTLTSCYATGSVRLTGSYAVGGLVGTNGGTLTSCYATGSVSGVYYVGGLVGFNWLSLTSCFATGLVSGTDLYVGGLVGTNNGGTLTGCFWDIQTSGKTTSSTGGTGKTTAEMMTPSTFTDAGWDFTDTDGDPADCMMLRPGEDYPRLAWQPVFAGDIAGLYGVNLVDYARLAVHWGQTGCPTGCENADIDGSGTVDTGDLVVLAENWLEGI